MLGLPVLAGMCHWEVDPYIIPIFQEKVTRFYIDSILGKNHNQYMKPFSKNY